MKHQTEVMWTTEKFDPVVKELVKQGELLTYHKNTIVRHAEQECSQFFVVASGLFRVYTCSREHHSKEITHWFCFPGEFIGETTLFDNSYSTSIQAMENSCCYLISKEVVLEFAQTHTFFANMLFESLSKRTTRSLESLRDIAFTDTYSRLCNFFNENSISMGENIKRMKTRLTHAQIAQCIGCSREMISRIMKDLVAGKYIHLDANKLYIIKYPLPKGW